MGYQYVAYEVVSTVKNGIKTCCFGILHPFRPCNSKVHWYRRLGLRHETQHLPKELSDKQPADILQYTKSHSEEVEAEYQQVLAYADENRRYWEKRKNEHFEKIKSSPPLPGKEQLYAKLRAAKKRLGMV